MHEKQQNPSANKKKKTTIRNTTLLNILLQLLQWLQIQFYTHLNYDLKQKHVQVHLNKLECRGKVHLFQ